VSAQIARNAITPILTQRDTRTSRREGFQVIPSLPVRASHQDYFFGSVTHHG